MTTSAAMPTSGSRVPSWAVLFYIVSPFFLFFVLFLFSFVFLLFCAFFGKTRRRGTLESSDLLLWNEFYGG